MIKLIEISPFFHHFRFFFPFFAAVVPSLAWKVFAVIRTPLKPRPPEPMPKSRIMSNYYMRFLNEIKLSNKNYPTRFFTFFSDFVWTLWLIFIYCIYLSFINLYKHPDCLREFNLGKTSLLVGRYKFSLCIFRKTKHLLGKSS